MVFEAEDRQGGGRVALKLIHTHRSDEAFRTRVEREIEILKSLIHPHVVRYLDSGTTDETLIHLVLEWLSGEDLADYSAKRALSLGAALEIAGQVADALEVAHARGIVHRDVKPANVFLVTGDAATPSVRVLDFGVAKQSEAQGVTQAGAILGTPSYMAPEQAHQARRVDGRADVFSLGVVLFEMIAGRLPWASHSELARLARILVEPALSLSEVCPDVPKAVVELVDAMLRIDPDERVANMAEVRRRLEECRDALAPESLSRTFAPVVPVSALEDFGRVETKSVQAVSVDLGPPEVLPLFDSSSSSSTEPFGTLSPRPTPASGVPALPMEEGNSLSHVALHGRGELFGREGLLQRIEREVLRALTAETPTSILLLGPAGAGKTRLRTELQRRLKSLPREPTVLAGRAEEPVRAAPYRFLRRLLLLDARVFPDDLLEERARKVTQLVPDPDLAGPKLGGLGLPADSVAARQATLALLGLVLDVPQASAVSLDTLRADPAIFSAELERILDQLLFSRASERGLVLLVDDAHLLDQKSAEVLAGLVDGARRARLVVIAFAQPTIQSAEEPGSVLAEASRVTIDLPPLAAEDAASMIRALAGAALDGASESALVERCGGSPLQLEQVTRAVLESRVLEAHRDGVLRLSAPAQNEGSELVPPTAAAAVRTRLRQLGRDLQRTLASAAIFGDVFWAEGVAALSEQSLERTTEQLDKLLLADLVRRRPAARYREVSELEFSHSVVRRVVLSKIRPGTRQPLELKAARYLEARGEGDAATLAGHLLRAGEIEHGARMLGRAAGLSLSLGAFEDAWSLAEASLEAVQALPDPEPVLAELLEVAAESAAQLGRDSEAEDALRRLLGLPISDTRRAAALLSRARAAVRAESYAEARLHAAAALDVHDRLDAPLERTEAELLKARCDEAMSGARDALRGYLGVKARAEGLAARGLLGQAVRGLARIGLASGDLRSAESRFGEALEHARASLDLAGHFESALGLAEVKLRAGEQTECERHLQAAESLVRTREQDGRAMIRRALSLAASSELDSARAKLAEVRGALASPRLLSLSLLHAVYLEVGSANPVLPTELHEQLRETHVRLSAEHRALDLPFEMALALIAAANGAEKEALSAMESARSRFAREGTLVEVEAARFLLARFMVLERTAARPEERGAALREVVEQLDLVGSRLERKMRGVYLERDIVRQVLALAAKHGVLVHRDALSGRLST